MKNQKIANIASQAAGTHVSELVNAIQAGNKAPEETAYAMAFRMLISECQISQEALEQRLTTWVGKNYEDRDPKGIVGNLVKESQNPNMGQKIFTKLVSAVFSE